MDNRLSTLIFCRDNIGNVLRLLREVYSFSDEIVLIDSSTVKNEKILRQKTSGNTKIKIYHAVALGHPEPYQMYGLSKCSYKWIFYIDTDERPNNMLKKEIRDIINSNEADAYLVRKKELDKGGNRYFDSYQCRLYKKAAAVYTGNVFYDPIISGTQKTLGNNYFLNHHFEYYENPSKLKGGYFNILAFEMREDYNGLIKSYKKQRIFSRFLNAYCSLKRIDKKSELTKFDYKFLFLTLGYFIHTLLDALRGKFPLFKFLMRNYFLVWDEINFLFTYPEPERKIQLEIAKGIKASGGVIKYLRIDENFVRDITGHYSKNNKIMGVDLFTLLLEAHNKSRHA